MKVTPTPLAGLLVLEPRVFGDERGFFTESFNQRTFAQAAGVDVNFVQDNHSRSAGQVLRGLHYQLRQPQGKLVRALRGSVFDVAVDIRSGSATCGQWFGIELSEFNFRQLWVPAGFAHGFLVTSDTAEVAYKTTDYYDASSEQCVLWDDPQLAIHWPLGQGQRPVLSAKDQAGVRLENAVLFP